MTNLTSVFFFLYKKVFEDEYPAYRDFCEEVPPVECICMFLFSFRVLLASCNHFGFGGYTVWVIFYPSKVGVSVLSICWRATSAYTVAMLWCIIMPLNLWEIHILFRYNGALMIYRHILNAFTGCEGLVLGYVFSKMYLYVLLFSRWFLCLLWLCYIITSLPSGCGADFWIEVLT